MTPDELRAARAALGLSNAELAARLGVSRRTVEAWLSGRYKISAPAALLLRTAAGAGAVKPARRR